MNALVGLAVLIFWPLVQIPLLMYLARRVDFDDDAAPAPTEYIPQADVDGGGGSADDSGGGRASSNPAGQGTVCYRCGVENDPGYDYCQNCVARLDMGGPYSTPS